jgi:hypothetical protein
MTQPPVTNVYLEYQRSPQGIREIAARQRAILLCILAGFAVYAAMIVGQRSLPPVALLVLLLAMVGVEITSVVFVFLLTTKLYGAGVGVLLGILTMVPCVGLITLLVVNAKATSILKAAGLKVGLLGARVPADL